MVIPVIILNILNKEQVVYYTVFIPYVLECLVTFIHRLATLNNSENLVVIFRCYEATKPLHNDN